MAVLPDAPTVTDTDTLDEVAAEATAFTCKVCAPPSSAIAVTAVEVSDESTTLRVIVGVDCPAAGTEADKNATPNTDATPKPATSTRRITASFPANTDLANRPGRTNPARCLKKRYPPPQFVKLSPTARHPRPKQAHNAET